MIGILDFFVLYLIHDGIRTPYSLQSTAGLSLGSTLPSLRRLLAAKLIVEESAGTRKRRDFRLSRAGDKQLDKAGEYVRSFLLRVPSDLESIVRLVCIGVRAGQQELAAELLSKVAQQFETRATQRTTHMKPSSQLPVDVALLYRELMSRCDVERLRATATVLRDLLSELQLGTKLAEN